jgi:O-acetyl-ADP-ribose deacetylase (regulator of RNase III)
MSETIRQRRLPDGPLLLLNQGDLTLEAVDAIVNAANAHLRHGGGVAAAIAARGGPLIQEESDAWIRKHGPISHDRPAYTGGGNLPCRYVIHALGPVWGEGGEDVKLSEAVSSSLSLADSLGLTSLALPAISTGIFGFPKERAARIIQDVILDYFARNPDSGLSEIRMTLYDTPTLDAFVQVWDTGSDE